MFLEQVFHVVICNLLLFIYIKAVVDQLPRLGKRELICLLLFTCNYVASVWRGFPFLCVLGMGYVILLWHSLSLPYSYLPRNTVPSESCRRRLRKTAPYGPPVMANQVRPAYHRHYLQFSIARRPICQLSSASSPLVL